MHGPVNRPPTIEKGSSWHCLRWQQQLSSSRNLNIAYESVDLGGLATSSSVWQNPGIACWIAYLNSRTWRSCRRGEGSGFTSSMREVWHPGEDPGNICPDSCSAGWHHGQPLRSTSSFSSHSYSCPWRMPSELWPCRMLRKTARWLRRPACYANAQSSQTMSWMSSGTAPAKRRIRMTACC